MQRIGTAQAALLGLGVMGGLVTGAAGAFAQEHGAAERELHPVTQEMFLGTVAFSQDAMELQFSAASSWMKGEHGHHLHPHLLAEFGLTDRLELGVEAPFVVSMPSEGDSSGGLGNAEVGLFYNFVRAPALGLVASAGVAAVMPTASTDLIHQAYGGTAVLALYKVAGPVHLSASAGGGVEAAMDEEEGEESEAEFLTEAALGLLVPLGAFNPIAEVGLAHEGENELRAAAGFVVHLSHTVEIGLAGLLASNDAETEWGAAVDLTWERAFAEAK